MYNDLKTPQNPVCYNSKHKKGNRQCHQSYYPFSHYIGNMREYEKRNDHIQREQMGWSIVWGHLYDILITF